MKLLLIVKRRMVVIAFATSLLAIVSSFFGSWFLIIPIAVIAGYTYLIVIVYREPFTPADNNYWYPSATLIKELVPKVFTHLMNHGYSKKDYQTERHDCDDYVPAQIHVLHDYLLSASVDIEDAQNRALPIYPFSFRRENGKRHRLIYVVDDQGKRHYVENYPVFDKYHDESGMYRLLSPAEVLNGYRPS